jgi:hypothetical protein
VVIVTLTQSGNALVLGCVFEVEWTVHVRGLLIHVEVEQLLLTIAVSVRETTFFLNTLDLVPILTVECIFNVSLHLLISLHLLDRPGQTQQASVGEVDIEHVC